MSSGANLCSLYTWHGTLNTVHGCFEKLLHTYHMQFKSCAWTLQRNIGLSSKLNASQIRTCVNLRTAVVQFWDGIRKKNQMVFFSCLLVFWGVGRVRKGGWGEWVTLGRHMSHSRDKGWLIKAVIYYMRNIWIIMMWLDFKMSLFSAGWPLNLSGGTYATQERQRVTSFCRTVNPIMDSVCAFAIFGKCQQRR